MPAHEAGRTAAVRVADAGLDTSRRQRLTFCSRIERQVAPRIGDLRTRIQLIGVSCLKHDTILIDFAPETDVNLDGLRDLGTEVQNLVCAAGAKHIVLQAALAHRVQKRKHADEVRLARPVWADQHIDGIEPQLVDRSDALEAADSDCVQFTHGALPLSRSILPLYRR